MKVERLPENIRPLSDSTVTVKKMGHITEVRYMQRKTGGIIQKLDRDSYVDTRTGEVKDFIHSDARIENIESVSRSLRNLRDIINTNVTDVKKCLWVTLTYAENMTDGVRLYNDYRKFNMRFQRYLQNNGLPKCEYIAAAEPQGRGAWHLHIIYIFSRKALFVENSTLAMLWGHGFVSISSLKGIDNVGVYLSAYLSDMDALKALETVDFEKNKNFKIVTADGNSDNRRKKAILKGARLRLYPTGFRIYRLSKGIKKPEIYETTEAEAMQEIKGDALTYEKIVQLSDDGKIINQINYRHYNNLKKEGTEP
jgi:hypothetical protein